MSWERLCLVAGFITLSEASNSPLMAEAYRFGKIADAGKLISTLLEKENLKPEQLLVIFDVDGTLTSRGDPEEKETALPRGDAISVVNGLKKAGVNLVASSAWDDFHSVLVRINDLGLSGCFGYDLKSAVPVHKKERFASPVDGKLSVEIQWYGAGNAVSVQDPEVDPEFFRQKALAPYLVPAVAEKLNRHEIRHVVFIDDSEGNIGIFYDDAARLKLFDKIQVDTIELGDAEDDPAGHE